MKFLLTISFLFGYTSANALTVDQCFLIEDFKDHKITAEKLCAKGSGNCQNKNEAQLYCTGLNGAYCININTMAQAYCMISGGNYCSNVPETDEAKYEDALKLKCREMIRALATKKQ